MKIYTKAGDTGLTFLARSRKKLPKNHPVFCLLGSLDVFNSVLGCCKAYLLETAPFKDKDLVAEALTALQNAVFAIGAEINLGSKKCSNKISSSQIEVMEKLIDYLDAKSPPLRNFILPSDSIPVSMLHLARGLCRQAERDLIRTKTYFSIRNELVIFLNRASDMLFVISRFVGNQLGVAEKIWTSECSFRSFEKLRQRLKALNEI
jgi:cob(I)alamin adenosyltransferase